MEYIIFIIVLIVFFSVILSYNRFVRLNNKMKQAKSSIEVYLTQRFDLIPNLVECVKSYASYEQETLMKITELRTQFSNNKDLKLGAEVNSQMNILMAVAEANPNLKTSEQFLNLQRNLEKMESQLQAARRVFNGEVTLYNTTISTFPNNILASLFGYKEAELFEIEEYKRNNIKVEI